MPTRPPRQPSRVNFSTYVNGVRMPGETSLKDPLWHVPHDGFVWIALHEPTSAELADMTAHLDFHCLAGGDVLNTQLLPGLERYEQAVFTTFKTVRHLPACEHPARPLPGREAPSATQDTLLTGRMVVFTGARFALTDHYGPQETLALVRQDLEADSDRLATGPSAVLYAIASHVIDDYLTAAEAVRADVECIESAMFSRDTEQSVDLGRIYELKRNALTLRHAVAPLERPVRALATGANRLVHPDMKDYFRDTAQRLQQAADQLSASDELLDSLLETQLAQLALTQNDDMRKVSAWLAIIAVPTMVCGVCGMNFDHMSELRTHYGYPVTLSIVAAVCLLLHRLFRRKGWL